jgi:hypothetical protein
MKPFLPFLFALFFVIACKNEEQVDEAQEDDYFKKIELSASDIKRKGKIVKNAFDCDINFAPHLVEHGLYIGDYYLAKDTATGLQNILKLNVLFKKDFSGKLMARHIRKTGFESGKVTVKFKAKLGQKKIIVFPFGSQIPIEAKSLILVE